MIHRSPLSIELMCAAIAVHSLEPFRRALLAHALVSDPARVAIATLKLGREADVLRDLLLDDDWCAVARLGGLRTAVELNPHTQTPELFDLADAVDAITVRELAEVGPIERLIRHAQPGVTARRIRRRERRREEQRDVLPPSREAFA